jgi:hypothetical protein
MRFTAICASLLLVALQASLGGAADSTAGDTLPSCGVGHDNLLFKQIKHIRSEGKSQDY